VVGADDSRFVVSGFPLQRPYGAKQARTFLNEVLSAAPDVPVQIAHLAGGGCSPMRLTWRSYIRPILRHFDPAYRQPAAYPSYVSSSAVFRHQLHESDAIASFWFHVRVVKSS
jgi:hypothetical protein